MGSDPRIGNRFLKAGIGYGGSCFPKDTKALHWLGHYHGYELKTIKAAIEVNEAQKLRLLKKAQRYCENLNGKKVAVLGLTFKPNTDDLRDAPALENIPILADLGAEISVWDPVGMDNFRQRTDCEVAYCGSIDEAVRDADLCMIFTEWPAVIQYDVNNYVRLMKTPLILDGRNCYDLEQFDGVAALYDSIGRKTVNNLDDSRKK